MHNELKELIVNHTGKITDKWSLYMNVWDKFLSPYQEKEINIFEIGINNGGSLEIWSEYFVNAKHIIGCDIDEKCSQLKYQDSRISIIIGDVNTDEVEERLSETVSNLDILIDDGSHKSVDIIHSFIRYFKKLNDNGIYLIEDLHASYWEEFGGGLHFPYSAMSFFKRLADIVNFEHWRTGYSRKDYLAPFLEYYDLDINEFDLCRLHSISFINSLCIIQSQNPEENKLGKRHVIGLQEDVTENLQSLDGTTVHDMAVLTNNDLHFDPFFLINEVERLKIKVEEQNRKCAEFEREIVHYASSKSWRITRPMRKIVNFLKQR